jgi:hypothetical protein
MDLGKLKGVKHRIYYMGEPLNVTLKPDFSGETYDQLEERAKESGQRGMATAEALTLTIMEWDMVDSDGPIPVGRIEDAEEIYRRVPMVLAAFINDELGKFAKNGGLGKRKGG